MKRLGLYILILVMFIPSLVLAKDIEIVSITPVYDESSGVVLNEDNEKSFNATFNGADQEVKYNVVIKNTLDKDIQVSDINISSPTFNFMSYELNYLSIGDILASNEEKEIELSISSQHASDILQNFNDNVIFEIVAGNKGEVKGVENPRTGIQSFLFLIPILIFLLGIYYFIRFKNKGFFYKISAFAVLMGISLFAKDVNALDSYRVSIDGSVDYKSLNIMEPRYPDFTMIENDSSAYDLFSYRWDYNNQNHNLLFEKCSYINELDFIANGQAPEDYDLSEDISLNEDGKVTIYLKQTYSHTYSRPSSFDDSTYYYTYNYYHAYIVADGMIYFPESSAYLFQYLNASKVNGLENTGTDYVKYMYYMFSDMGNTKVGDDYQEINIDWDFSHWNLSNVVTMKNMFYQSYEDLSFNKRVDIKINFEGTDTSSVLDMSSMFGDFASGTIFGSAGENGYPINIELNMNNINVENVKDFDKMFYCFMRGASTPKLEIKGWTINGNVKYMFSAIGVQSPNKAYLTIEDFTMNNGAVQMFDNMAGNSNSGGLIATLKNIKVVGSAKEMLYGLMYSRVPENELHIINWDTSETTNMEKMFYNVNVKEIDLSSFDITNVEKMDNMFTSNYLLEKLYITDKWNYEHLNNSELTNFIQYESPLYFKIKAAHDNSFDWRNMKGYMNTQCGNLFTDKNNPTACE